MAHEFSARMRGGYPPKKITESQPCFRCDEATCMCGWELCVCGYIRENSIHIVDDPQAYWYRRSLDVIGD